MGLVRARLAGMAVVLLMAASTAVGQARYRITDLGAGSYSSAWAINNSGQAIGYAYDMGYFLYSGDVRWPISLLTGISYSPADALNDAGEFVGVAQFAGNDYHAYLYSNGVMQDLGSFGGDSVAEDINSAGQVVGYSTGPYNNSQPFLYTDGVMHDLGGDYTGDARGINDSGMVVGYGGIHLDACYWDSNMVFHDLGTLPGYPYSIAEAVNNAGQIVGSGAFDGGPDRPFLFSGGAMQNLGSLGWWSADANGINDSGQVVGVLAQAKEAMVPDHAFLSSGGVMYDLNDLLDSSVPPGWVLLDARSINNSGQIVGTAIVSAVQHAYLATPVGVCAFSGAVDFGDFTGCLATPALALIARNPADGTVLGETTVHADATGMWSAAMGLDDGTYELMMRAPHWLLQKRLITVSAGQCFTTFKLINGDADGNNNIGIGDLSVVLGNWRTADAMADLDGSGSVGFGDLSIVLSNYGLAGDQ